MNLLKKNLQKTRKQMELQANKKRRDFTFYKDDLVLLRLQPYRQNTVHRSTSQKLSQRLFGPFKVLEQVGSVAYRLNLPPNSRIPPVVHISLLRPYHCENSPQQYQLYLTKKGMHTHLIRKTHQERNLREG